MLNGVTQLIMMKSDVLDDFDEIKACVAYKINGVETNQFPFSIEEDIEPVYVTLPGWKTDMTKMQSEEEFPQNFKNYIDFLEKNWLPRLRLFQSALTVSKLSYAGESRKY